MTDPLPTETIDSEVLECCDALCRELRGWTDGPGASDDTIRKHWLMREAANRIEDLVQRNRELAAPIAKRIVADGLARARTTEGLP